MPNCHFDTHIRIFTLQHPPKRSLLCCGSLCHLQKALLNIFSLSCGQGSQSNKASVHNLPDELSLFPKRQVDVGGGYTERGCFVSFVGRRMAAVKCSVKCLLRPQSVEVGWVLGSAQCDMLLKKQMFMNYARRSVCVVPTHGRPF